MTLYFAFFYKTALGAGGPDAVRLALRQNWIIAGVVMLIVGAAAFVMGKR